MQVTSSNQELYTKDIQQNSVRETAKEILAENITANKESKHIIEEKTLLDTVEEFSSHADINIVLKKCLMLMFAIFLIHIACKTLM